MKRILLALCMLAAGDAVACDRITRKYNTATTVDFCLYTTDATVGAVKVENAVHASGDTYLMKDEAAEANTTNGFTDEGSCYSIALTATEMQAARIALNIEDQGTKAWADKCVIIETYGNASAQHAIPDVNTATITAGAITASAVATGAIDADAVADDAIDAGAIAANAIGASEIATDAIGAAEIAASAITSSEAPNLDAAVSSVSGGSGGTKGQN